MQMSEQINELAAALAKAQSQFKHVTKDKTAKIRMKAGGEYSYSYADLGSTWDVARGPLTSNGLSISQLPSFADGWLQLTTILMHSSGQYISSQMQTRADEMDVKSIGSAITYLRRYAFASITGLVADEDDDGSAPNGRTNSNGSASYNAPAAERQPTNGNGGGGKASEKQIKSCLPSGIRPALMASSRIGLPPPTVAALTIWASNRPAKPLKRCKSQHRRRYAIRRSIAALGRRDLSTRKAAAAVAPAPASLVQTVA